MTDLFAYIAVTISLEMCISKFYDLMFGWDWICWVHAFGWPSIVFMRWTVVLLKPPRVD